MNRRFFLLLASIGLAAGLLPGCTKSDNTAGTGAAARPLIGLSLDTLKEARWVSDRDLFIKRCNELGADVKVEAANSDDSQQAKDVQSLLTDGVKVLVIVPHDAVAMGISAEDAKKSGIPVIAYDRLMSNCDLDLYMSFDNVRVGRQQAQYLVDHLPTPGHGKIVRIYGSQTDNNAKLFKQGQDEVLKPYLDKGDITVVHEDWAEDWKAENAKRIMNAALAKGATFDGVLVSNDGTAGGAIQALAEAGLAGKVVVTGQDADIAALQRIASGTQSMTIYKPVAKLAAIAAEQAVAMAQGKTVQTTATIDNGKMKVPAIYLESVTVTKDNIVDAVVKDGFHTYDDIYGQLPESARPPRPQ
jgi:D-xylose transport system substrate-binding protein